MSSIKKLTGMGGDIRQIAKLLQAKAPPGHKLAYINDEEAALLKSRGGSGRLIEDTGIRSYDEASIDIGFGPGNFQPTDASTGGSATSPSNAQIEQNIGIAPAPAQASTAAPIADTFVPATGVSTPGYGSEKGLATAAEEGGYVVPNATSSAAFRDLYPAGSTAPNQATMYTPGGQAVAIPEPTITQAPSAFDKFTKSLTEPRALAALGIGGTEALLGASSVKKAQQEAAQSKQQLQAMAAPYQQQGQQLQQLAQQGQLTPANQQTLQAARAQLAQGAEARGGVGTQQAANQIAALTQNLLANQMNLGLQLQGVGDKIAQGAIQTGIQADQYINQLTSNYAQNIARTVASGVGMGGTGNVTVTTS